MYIIIYMYSGTSLIQILGIVEPEESGLIVRCPDFRRPDYKGSLEHVH